MKQILLVKFVSHPTGSIVINSLIRFTRENKKKERKNDNLQEAKSNAYSLFIILLNHYK